MRMEMGSDSIYRLGTIQAGNREGVAEHPSGQTQPAIAAASRQRFQYVQRHVGRVADDPAIVRRGLDVEHRTRREQTECAVRIRRRY